MLVFWNMSSLLVCGNQSEIGQIIQAGDITNHEASSFFIQAEKFTVFLSNLQ
jgi:hypothetical protein